jgi:DNA-binding MarR family transcriptional regulator
VGRARRAGRELPGGLEAGGLAAWRALLTAHATVVDRIEHDLAGGGGLVPLTWYDVLLELNAATGRRMRQRDLAREVVLTRSGISRLVDRLAGAGLLRREPNPADRRGDLVALTDAGRDALRRTWPAYARGIREHFARHLTAEEARVLATALARVRGAATGEASAGATPAPPPTPAPPDTPGPPATLAGPCAPARHRGGQAPGSR